MSAALAVRGNRSMVDWIPGALSGVLTGAAGALLTAWRALGVLEERAKASDARYVALAGQYDAKFVALAIQQDKTDRTAERREELVMGEIRDALRSMQGLAADVKVIATNQDTINHVTAKTMESLLAKMERHDEILVEHSTAIAVLVAKIQGEHRT